MILGEHVQLVRSAFQQTEKPEQSVSNLICSKRNAYKSVIFQEYRFQSILRDIKPLHSVRLRRQTI
jgi:hypothetical protein